MANFKPAPDDDLSSHVEDETPIPRHEFTEANQLDRFTLDPDLMVQMPCPDCGAFCVPTDLGEAVDWALGHKCATTGGE